MTYDENNIFGKILRKEIPSTVVYEDDSVFAFEDINPQAPVHILFIPKKSVATVDDFQVEDAELIGKLVLAAKKVAHEKGFTEGGYRLVFNTLGDGGQDVYHVHLHLLAGRKFGWPPG